MNLKLLMCYKSPISTILVLHGRPGKKDGFPKRRKCWMGVSLPLDTTFRMLSAGLWIYL